MILVTLLGKEARETNYQLENRTCSARLAPVAIVSLRGGFSEVVALCTEQAAESTFPVLQQDLDPRIRTRREDIPLATSDDEIEPFLERLTQVIDAAGDDVALDVTHGPRHLQFLVFAVALYLSALGRAQVVGTYYGFLSARGQSLIVDLRPLLELAALAFAAGELRRTGSTKALVERLQKAASGAVKVKGVNIKDVASQLEGLAAAFGSGLPLETGAEALHFRCQYKKPLTRFLRSRRVPLSKHLVQAIDEELARFALPQEPPLPRGWKARYSLSRAELERESGLVDALFERGAYGPAAIVAQEWIVSWALLEQGEASRWLQWKVRDRTRDRLNALATHARDAELRRELTADQVRLGEFWYALKELRNSLAHAGMRSEEVDLWRQKGTLPKILREVRSEWSWMKEFPKVPLEIEGTVRRLLVTPVGRAPGAFYSALQHAYPVDRCLCICSAETTDLVKDVLDTTSCTPEPEAIQLLLPDPHGDLDRAEGLVKDARDHLARAEEVVLNLTGGTTLMGLTVEWMGDEARRLGRRVRRLVVLDRRPREEQEREPFVRGEAVWLDEEGR